MAKEKFWTGAEVREVRVRLDLNQNAFAKRLGVSQAAVAQWENTGIGEPKALRIMKIFGVDRDFLQEAMIECSFSCDIDAIHNAEITTGAELLELRKAHRMTQAALAEAVGVSRCNISAWETSAILPQPAIDKISIFLASRNPPTKVALQTDIGGTTERRARVKSMVDRVPDVHLPSLEMYISGLATDGPRAN
ncbi:MAG: helix-turn-helix transcriptional regulator [Thermoguttaceae bacterium]|nr:helix-turn-helix transcriptional regulator [Thermoguttaceae bacterium]